MVGGTEDLRLSACDLVEIRPLMLLSARLDSWAYAFVVSHRC